MFIFSENENYKHSRAISHLFRYYSLPISRIHFAWPQTKSLQFLAFCTAEPILCTCFLAWEQHGFAVGDDAGPGSREHVSHTALSHLPVPFGAEATNFFKAILVFFWRRHLVLWQLHGRSLGGWSVSPALITGFSYWKGSWHFHVPVSGHEKCEKAKVCLHLQSLFEVFRAKKKSSSLKKKVLLSFVLPVIHG